MRWMSSIAAAAACAALLGGCQSDSSASRQTARSGNSSSAALGAMQNADRQAGHKSPDDLMSMIASWPEVSKKAAQQVMQKYGPPRGVTPGMLVWENTGPWKRTIVYRDPVTHKFPMAHEDVLEQFIDYKIPADKFDDLASYDGSVIAERTKGELSARCDKEEMNFLAINLAHDVATGAKTIEAARAAYAKAAMAFKNGEKPEETQGFLFDVPTGGTGDPDQPMKP